MNVETPSASPFKFLDAYTAQDTNFFFGRQAEQRRLIELIFSSRLVLVYGASGTGKSSLIQCGLAKALSLSDYFPVVIRRRGDFNMALCNTLTGILGEADSQEPVELVSSLARQALRPVYLLFDQFEELFISGTQAEQLALVQTFQRLYDANVPCKLLVSMREEYIARLNMFEDMLPQLFDFRLRVEAMSERNLEEVIICTFQAIDGVELVDPKHTAQAIIQNIQLGKALFQLPYLQVYLDRLWRIGKQQVSEKGLDHISIDPALVASVGEIENVLETFFQEQKEALLLSLGTENKDDSQSSIDKVLESFVTYEGTRREQTLVRLVAETGLTQPMVWKIVSWLEKARLLRDDEGTYELPHDCLALVIDKGRSLAQRRLNDIIRRLKDSFYEYTSNPCDDFILTSRRLVEIQEIEPSLREELARTMPTEGEKIWTYISQSEKYHQRKQAEELQAQQAKYRRLQWTIAGVGFLLAIALCAFAIAWSQMQKMEKTTQRATALYWAIENYKLPHTESMWKLEEIASEELKDIAIYKRLFTRLSNISSFLPYIVNLYRKAYIPSAIFSQDGSHILTNSGDKVTGIWNMKGKQERLLVHEGDVQLGCFSPDGSHILTASWDSTATIWDLQQNKPVKLQHASFITSTKFIPDGSRVVTVSGDDSLRIWNLEGKKLAVLPHEDYVVSVNFSPDGQRILTASLDKTAKVWDLTGNLKAQLSHNSLVQSASFSPNGKNILTSSLNNSTSVWNVEENSVHNTQGTTTLLATLKAETAVSSCTFSPDGKLVLAVSRGHKATIWNFRKQTYQSLTHKDLVLSASFSPDGRHVLTVSRDHKATIWDLKGNKVQVLNHPNVITYAQYSPDGNSILTTSLDNKARLWNGTGKQIHYLEHEAVISSAGFSPDGTKILTASWDQTTKIWDLEGQLKAVLRKETGVVPLVSR